MVLGSWLGAIGAGHAALYHTTFPIEGTAVNVTNVIGAGNSGATTTFNKTNGGALALSGASGTIDAGQYSDGITMYLNNSGQLNCIRNNDGFNTGSYNVGDAFGVSGVVEVGGARYCVLGGTSSGVRLLALATGVPTALGSATNWNFSGARGLDAFLRPGGTTTNDIAVGVEFGSSTPILRIFNPQGVVLDEAHPTSANGTVNDASFDMANNKVWFGTKGSNTAGRLFDYDLDFSIYAVALPEVGVAVTNGVVTVNWSGRILEASGGDTNWTAVATAPLSPTQIFAPPPYTEPATNGVRFFRARW
jgi:hypothetical protein